MAEMRRRVNDSWLSAMVLAIDFEISSLKHVFEKRLDVLKKWLTYRCEMCWNTLEQAPHKKSLDWKTVQGLL